MKKLAATITCLLILSGCASSVTVAVDPGSIKDKAKFDSDYKLCQDVA